MLKNYNYTKTITYPFLFTCAQCKKEFTVDSEREHHNKVCLDCHIINEEERERIQELACVNKRSTLFDRI